jgi:hypothetical protein
MAHEPTLGTLAGELASRGAMPMPEAIAWTLEACEALAEAHAIGIAHGDIRPETVALARDSRGRVVAKVAWTGAVAEGLLDRAAVLRDIAGVANLFRALVSGGASDDAAPTLPSDLAHAIARATTEAPDPFANVGELARALARHAGGPSSAARRASLPLSRAGVVGSAIPLARPERERVSETWFDKPPPAPLGPPRRSARATAFLVVALALLGAALGGTFAMARTGLAREWTGTAPVLVATTTLTSAETGTTRQAEEVTAHAVEEWSLVKAPPGRVAAPSPARTNDFPPTSVDEEDGEDTGSEE